MADRGAGGMSGSLLKERAKKVRSTILQYSTTLELIGVGGVSEFRDLLDFWNDGGKVMQVYTSYINQGPALLHRMKKDMEKFLKFTEEKSLQSFLSLPLSDKQKMISEFTRRSSIS
jgi:dihydroorotate dehydrogenase